MLPFLDVSPATLTRVVRELGFTAFLVVVLEQMLHGLRWVREWLALRVPASAYFDNLVLEDPETLLYLAPPLIRAP